MAAKAASRTSWGNWPRKSDTPNNWITVTTARGMPQVMPRPQVASGHGGLFHTSQGAPLHQPLNNTNKLMEGSLTWAMPATEEGIANYTTCVVQRRLLGVTLDGLPSTPLETQDLATAGFSPYKPRWRALGAISLSNIQHELRCHC